MKKALFLISLFSLAAASIISMEETIVLGNKDNWESINSRDNITFREGRGGFYDIELKDGEYDYSQSTDLLIHFNSDDPRDQAGNYITDAQGISISTANAVLGSGAGIFYREAPGIILTPLKNALFSSGMEWTDFTIEFWFYSANLQDEEIIFIWKGYRKVSDTIIPQEISFGTFDRKLRWRFKNFFAPPDRREFSLELSGEDNLVPRKWYHHALRFDSTTGLLEYLVNGKPEAVTYANPSGSEQSSVYVPLTGTVSKGFPVIGQMVTGFIDELRISSEFTESPFVRKYTSRSGRAATAVVDLELPDAKPLAVNSIYNTPGKTDISFYYKAGNYINYKGEIAGGWVPFVPGMKFSPGTSFRYIQFMFELYPDPFNNLTPAVSEISLNYIPALPLLPPSGLSAAPGNGEAVLTWNKVEDDNIAGYMVYFGESPGYYFGSGNSSSSSPIDAGNTTKIVIPNLENGKLYYFTVVSYNSSEPPDISSFSAEVSARPSRTYGVK